MSRAQTSPTWAPIACVPRRTVGVDGGCSWSTEVTSASAAYSASWPAASRPSIASIKLVGLKAGVGVMGALSPTAGNASGSERQTRVAPLGAAWIWRYARTPMLRLRLFGGLAAEVDGRPIAPPASRRAWSLLAWLALHPGVQSRAGVAAALWP